MQPNGFTKLSYSVVLFLVLFGTELSQIPLVVFFVFFLKYSFWNCKSHLGWGLDDQVSFPALDETAECNTFVSSFSFNVLMLMEKKLWKSGKLG